MTLSESCTKSPFLPTPSARRATAGRPAHCPDRAISTHALREEGDGGWTKSLPVGVLISTHALREEGDPVQQGHCGGRRDFYPRPPRGGRPVEVLAGLWGNRFLPTPSARRATLASCNFGVVLPISTHALREEGDAGGGVVNTILP